MRAARRGLGRRAAIAVGMAFAASGVRAQRGARDLRVVARGLKFPEGPIALSDGSVIICEIERRTLTRISANGSAEVIADLGGGPNGAALGPDGACYVCNNGGLEFGGVAAPQRHGSIQRVDLGTGAFTTLYAEVGGHPLIRPNDLVFDGTGGFWFTDMGKSRARSRDHAGVYWARADGSEIREVIYPLPAANGIALAPDGRTLYVAQGKLCAYRTAGPGAVEMERRWIEFGRQVDGRRPRGVTLARPDGDDGFDSMKVEASGRIVVGTIGSGCLTVIAPDQGPGVGATTRIPMPDPLPTNLAFGGPDLMTAYICLSSTGQLAALDWPRAGLKLHHAA